MKSEPSCEARGLARSTVLKGHPYVMKFIFSLGSVRIPTRHHIWKERLKRYYHPMLYSAISSPTSKKTRHESKLSTPPAHRVMGYGRNMTPRHPRCPRWRPPPSIRSTSQGLPWGLTDASNRPRAPPSPPIDLPQAAPHCVDAAGTHCPGCRTSFRHN